MSVPVFTAIIMGVGMIVGMRQSERVLARLREIVNKLDAHNY